MQTAVEWLGFNLNAKLFDKVSPYEWEEINNIFKIALKKEKKQIIDAYEAGEDNIDQDACHIDDYGKVNYYNETYGSKGSDECCTPKGQIKRYVDCIGCDKNPKNNIKLPTSSQTEISDEEIEIAATKYATNHGMMAYVFPEKKQAFIDAIKWYREQLKTK